jgi:uncharacterized protein YpmB
MDIEQTFESIERRLKDYCWFVCLGEGEDEKIIVYIKNDGLAEKNVVNKIMKEYTDNYKIIKLAAYSPGGKNV